MPKLRIFVITGVILALVGWGGMAAVIFLTLPTLGPRWLFYFFLTIALTGTTLPLVGLLNARFPTRPQASGNVVLREAIWIGIFGGLIAWLLRGHVLSTSLAIFLGGGLILIEVLLRLRERSRFKPQGSDNE